MIAKKSQLLQHPRDASSGDVLLSDGVGGVAMQMERRPKAETVLQF
jgi:hypothetical protein